jgi:hypothetical protein
MLKRPDDAEVLAHTVSAMLELSRRRGLEARSAAQRAIEEALAARIGATRPGAAPGQRSDSSVARRRLLQEYETRRLASTAFLHAGGTRGEFERAWPQLISDVTQGRGR